MSAADHSRTPRGGSGRPRASSRAMLAEAAAELFIEQTYAGTTIDQIAQRAGVSRNTFFNYFPAKSDVLWYEVDDSLRSFGEILASIPDDVPVMTAVRSAILSLAGDFSPARVPIALTQFDLMGTSAELESSALSRFLAVVRQLSADIGRRLGASAGALEPQAIATAVIGAAVAAAGVWARSGVHRGALTPFVADAVTPVCSGYQGMLDRQAATR